MCCKKIGNAHRCTHHDGCKIDVRRNAQQNSEDILLAWLYVFAGYLRSTSFTGFADEKWSVQLQGKGKNGTTRWKGGLAYHYAAPGFDKPHYPVPALRDDIAYGRNDVVVMREQDDGSFTIVNILS